MHRRSRGGFAHRRQFAWEKAKDGELLSMRLRDLGVTLEGSWLEGPIARLADELARRDLRLRPRCWLSDEWFSPEGVPGIAIPFYLAHPRLMRLERRKMLEVEGGTRRDCLRLLRHEMGHVLQTGFRLHRRRRWQELFGRSSQPYPEYYRPYPASQRYVFHLDYWYAQSHPDEDFAETFAVWLSDPKWRAHYEGWFALKKLEYVDELMADLAGRTPPVRSRARVEPLSRLDRTLAEYYEAKRERFAWMPTTIYDSDLQRLFVSSERRRGEPAATFLRRSRREIRQMVAKGTGRHEFALDAVLRDMIARCEELGLRAARPRRGLLVDFAILLAARSVQYVYRGRDWHAL
jgi:hypothetical protein